MAGSEDHERSSYELFLRFVAVYTQDWPALGSQSPCCAWLICCVAAHLVAPECGAVRSRLLPLMRGIDPIYVQSLLQGPSH